MYVKVDGSDEPKKDQPRGRNGVLSRSCSVEVPIGSASRALGLRAFVLRLSPVRV